MQLNLFYLLSKEYTLKKITAEEGILKLKINQNGIVNYIFWKINRVEKLTTVIDLNGTWFGTFEWRSCNNKEESKMSIVIKQNYKQFKIISYTEKSTNSSYNEHYIVNRDTSINELSYSYSQRGQDVDDRFKYSGSSELKIKSTNNGYILKGDFWTENMTLGNIHLQKISNEKIHSFEDALDIFNEE